MDKRTHDKNRHTIPPAEKIIALAGNPNVGKSTIFNSLTGLNQHTGNWPGKTVSNARGKYTYENQTYTLVDLPGTYSLMAHSAEEEVARDFLCFDYPDAVVIVVDATCLERNLNLVLQTMEICPQTILCVNLLDEAAKKHITVNLPELEEQLGIPVVGAAARNGKGLEELMAAIAHITQSNQKAAPLKIPYLEPLETAINMLTPAIEYHIQGLNSRWIALQLLGDDKILWEKIAVLAGEDFRKDPTFAPLLAQANDLLTAEKISLDARKDMITAAYISKGEQIYHETVTISNENYAKFDRKLDKILTSKTWGIPMMILLLGIIFWLTIVGANYPSQLLSKFFFSAENWLLSIANTSNLPLWFTDLFICGVFRTLGWVISVMLPPMAIFFPLFTLLEDLGYLPRLAFNLDKLFKECHACGKQALTIC
ncbi:MAG: ferrous iron transporter B [Peptococcaceae bacterium]|jgi:ferrous iron transport protein B|nr:ferrous iron transporter B [Peptococcaceae bacterium]